MSQDPNSRAFEMSLDLDHDPKTVWQALTDPEKLVQWFPQEAVVTPGEGGDVLWKWDGVGQFKTQVETWEPGKRLRLLEAKTNAAGEPATHVMDFQLGKKGHGTNLRLVHSGFGHESEWDDEFAGITAGWNFELRVLRHYLNHHQGKPRHMALFLQKSAYDPVMSHAKVLGPQGFRASGSIAGIAEGGSYQMHSAYGDDFSGQVMVNSNPSSFAGIVPTMDQGIFRYEQEGDSVFIALEMWGSHAQTTQAFQEKWQPILKQLLS